MKKTIYMLALLMLFAAKGTAQGTYRTLVERYMAASGNSQFDDLRIKSQLKQMAMEDGRSEMEASAKAATFYDIRLKPVMAGIMENHMIKYVDDDELLKVVEKLETDEGRNVRTNTLGLLNESILHTLSDIMLPAITALLSNDTPGAIDTRAVDKRYRKLFRKYQKACGYDSLFDTMVNVLTSRITSDSDERDKEFMGRLLRYLKDNSDRLLLMVCKACYTEQDLRFMTELYSMKEYKACAKASKEAMGDIQKVFMRMEFE